MTFNRDIFKCSSILLNLILYLYFLSFSYTYAPILIKTRYSPGEFIKEQAVWHMTVDLKA